MNVKDLFENEELMSCLVEDIEDIPEDSEVTYEVWALGYDTNDEYSGVDIKIGEFEDPDEAIACASRLTVSDIRRNAAQDAVETSDEFAEYIENNVSYFNIEVETVVDYYDDGTMNIGTIYQREILFKPDLMLTSSDYTLLEDGVLKVRCELLKNYNKNDYIYVRFSDEPDSCLMTYKIVSKVIYADGNYYHCKLMI